MSEDDIKAIVASEMSNCTSDELVNALSATPCAILRATLPAPSVGSWAGPSVVSTDVADAVEWLLPNIVESH